MDEQKKEIILCEAKLRDTSNLLSETAKSITEGLTGLTVSEKKELILSASRIFQSYRSVGFINTLKIEWDKLREKGKIKDDYMNTEQHQACIGELLEALDRDNPDEIKFNILKKIFLVAATESQSNRESVLPHQYMVLARFLSSGEVLVLEAAHRIAKTHKFDINQDKLYENSLARIANESGLRFKDLVRIHEMELIEKNLFTIRMGLKNQEAHIGEHFRLTDLGWDFCEYAKAYDNHRTDR